MTKNKEKSYRNISCKNCGTKNKFDKLKDEWELDEICDECGNYLEEYK